MRAKQYLAVAACIGLSAGMFVAAPAMAQSGDSGFAAPQSSAGAVNITDAQVQKYVEAQAKVQRIGQEWQSKIRNAEDKKTALEYRRQANQQMTQAIKNVGLSIEEYNQITRAASSNQALAKRIQQAR